MRRPGKPQLLAWFTSATGATAALIVPVLEILLPHQTQFEEELTVQVNSDSVAAHLWATNSSLDNAQDNSSNYGQTLIYLHLLSIYLARRETAVPNSKR